MIGFGVYDSVDVVVVAEDGESIVSDSVSDNGFFVFSEGCFKTVTVDAVGGNCVKGCG